MSVPVRNANPRWNSPENLSAWKKSISPQRDRLQSRMLVWLYAPLLATLTFAFAFITYVVNTSPGSRHTFFPFVIAAVSATFALLTISLRATNVFAGITGGTICFCLTFASSVLVLVPESLFHTALPALFCMVVCTVGATRWNRKKKERYGLAEAKSGRRTSQIIANLGIAVAVLVLPYCPFADPAIWGPLTLTACIAALAEAAGDTVSSELGQALRGHTLLFPSLEAVAPGTDGGISMGGTLSGLAAAALVVATAIPTLHLSALQCGIAYSAAITGLFADSLLGTTLERRGWIGNDLVNFSSTAIAAGVALLLGRLL